METGFWPSPVRILIFLRCLFYRVPPPVSYTHLDVYKRQGGKRVFKGLITPDGADCRSQYFKSMEGTLNTYDKVNIKVGEYLGSTIRNWDVSKIEGNGPMRVEWYIEVDNGVEL